jgi:L-fuculose-phosphate aldolase
MTRSPTTRKGNEPTDKLVRDLVTAGHILYYAGWCERIDGHVSARCPGEKAILLPRHYHVDGRCLKDLRADDIMRMELDGQGNRSDEPVDEYHLHTEIYHARPDVQSVAHSRPFYATALSTTDGHLLPLTRHAAVFGGTVPVFNNGGKLSIRTAEEGRRIAETLGQGWAVLIRGLGVVTAGRTIEEATIRLGFLEDACRFQLVAGQLGSLNPLNPSELEEFTSRYRPETMFHGAWRYYERLLAKGRVRA